MNHRTSVWVIFFLMSCCACTASPNDSAPTSRLSKSTSNISRPKMGVEKPIHSNLSKDSLSNRNVTDYRQHVESLRNIIPEHFTVKVEPPFVVIGNGTPGQVTAHAEQTVRWTIQMLMRDFFSKEPSQIIDIWIFEDETSYMSYAKSIFQVVPDTPYGYYSAADRAMVMNIELGGGTLVHEIVHPFMEANFPSCPAWFNEGMGSLYEWPKDINGRIFGVVNWRLDELKSDIMQNRLPSFQYLMSLSQSEFYGQNSGTNYAQSRFLLQYLQYRKKLREYYHSFVKHAQTDPTGFNTLKEVLNISSVPEFESKWQNWVLGLSQGTVPIETSD